MKRSIALLLFCVVLCSIAGAGCVQHTHIVISSQSIGDYYCSMYEDETIEIIKYMGQDAVVQVPSGMNDRKVVGISTRAFLDNEYVEEVYLPASITSLPSKLFDNCANLHTIYVPDTVTTLGKELVSDCPEFTTLLYGGSEEQWGKVSKGNVLIDNYPIATAEMIYDFVVDSTEKRHVIVSTNYAGDFYIAVYADDTIEILDYVGSGSEVRVPSGINELPVVGINSKAFSNDTKVKTVYLPASLTKLPSKLFSNCSKLKTVYIPASVKTIGKGFVWECPEFRTVLYGGSESEWIKIDMGAEEDNPELFSAEHTYNYVVDAEP